MLASSHRRSRLGVISSHSLAHPVKTWKVRTCKSFNGSFANGCYDFADLEEGTGQLQTGKTQTYFFTHPAWGDDDGVLDTDELWRPDCQFMSSLFRMAQEVDPHVMMIVFLPTLLFESAFAMDYAIFRKQLSQIVVLAGPGVIVASLVTGLFVKAWYSHWSFNACWLLGTIVSATDPVAVVGLLKDLGADPKLGTMIEGESLLNDGSAVVLYAFLMSWITYDPAELPSDANITEGLGTDPPGEWNGYFPVTLYPWAEALLLVAQMRLHQQTLLLLEAETEISDQHPVAARRREIHVTKQKAISANHI